VISGPANGSHLLNRSSAGAETEDEMDRDFWTDAYQEAPDEVIVEDYFLDGELEDLQRGRALDLGCGSGPNALKLAEQGWSVVGVDWAENAIELARQSAKARGLDVTFLVGDITEWEPSGTFDLVLSTYALPGGESSRRALATALAALAPGGTLIVAEWDRSMAGVWGFGEDELMTPEQIVDLLPGLEIEKAEVRAIEDPFPSSHDSRGQGGSAVNVALVRARKPGSSQV
jgi:SAM-dependent methyltransferase